MPSNIVLKGDPIRKEAVTAGAAITPGFLLDVDTQGRVLHHASSGGNAEPRFAVEQDFLGGGIGDDYGTADRVQYVVCRPGDEVYAMLANAQNVAIGDYLDSNGDGRLKEHAPVYATNARLTTQNGATSLANSGIEWVARVPGTAGNDIAVQFVAPSSSLVVSVTGTTIVVALASGGSTGLEVIAACAADAEIMGLVSVGLASGHNGSATIDAAMSATNLTGGAAQQFEPIVARALEAGNTSGTITEARIKVEVV